MVLGRVDLSDGTTAAGFLCEPYAVEGAQDITGHGGWRAYRSSLAHGSPGPSAEHPAAPSGPSGV